MPKRTKSVPKHRCHKASGQAVVTLDGKDTYLGPHGSRPSRREYDRTRLPPPFKTPYPLCRLRTVE